MSGDTKQKFEIGKYVDTTILNEAEIVVALAELEEKMIENKAISKKIQVGSGWYGILAELHTALMEINPSYTIQQVKEKVGGLRYYIYYPPTDSIKYPIVDALVRHYENLSYETCEVCGIKKYGKQPEELDHRVDVSTEPNSRGWVRTLCDLCRESGDG